MTFNIFLGFFDCYWIIYQTTILCLDINYFFRTNYKLPVLFENTDWSPIISNKMFFMELWTGNYLCQVNIRFSSGEYCYSIKTLEYDELNDKKFYSILLKSVWLLAHFNVVWHSVIICTIGEEWRRKKTENWSERERVMK